MIGYWDALNCCNEDLGTKPPEVIILTGLCLALGIWLMIDPGPDHRNPWDF